VALSWLSDPTVALDLLPLDAAAPADLALFTAALEAANARRLPAPFRWRRLAGQPEPGLRPAPVVVLFGRGGEAAPAALGWLRRAARHGVRLCAVGGARALLPALGLPAPGLAAAGEPDLLYRLDQRGFACRGGVAILDLMAALLTEIADRRFALQVLDEFSYSEPRLPSQGQRLPSPDMLGIANRVVLAALARMEASIERPLDIGALSRHVGVTARQLQRLFAQHLGTSPQAHYRSLRLKRARHLLLSTAEPVLEVALASGFVSASHFTKSYQLAFGRRPSDERRERPGLVLAGRAA
jgi:transcriptional regulator GlxA family with amidase domain